MFGKINHANVARLSVVCLAIGGFSASALWPARAQSLQTLKQFETEAHTGPIEKALVGVEVSEPGQSGAAVRHGNGIVIRCDGFVVTAQALFGATVNSVTQKVMVTLNPGTAEARRVPARIVGAANMLRRAFAGKPEPLVILKLADIHAPALRLLLPDALAQEKAATLAWSAWDDADGRFLPIQKRPLALADPARRAQNQNKRLAFAQMEAVPICGAVVVGPEGMGIGLTTTAAAAAPDAASFATLNSLTNCITPQSATDAQFVVRSGQMAESENVAQAPVPDEQDSAEGAAGAKSGGRQEADKGSDEAGNGAGGAKPKSMARIPGGPARVNALLHAYQTDMAQAQTACVAPFLMDRYEVTNAQYQKFWQTFSPEERQRRKAELYPMAWAAGEPPFPKEADNTPVLGVPLSGAQAYATWAGKRLPTPYEWCRAAFGPNGGTEMPAWVQRYAADRRDTWNRIIAAHYEYTQRNPDVRNVGLESVPPNISPESALPWLFWYPFETPHARFSYNTIMQAAKHLWQEWKDPQHILPVGSRNFDVSPYGVRDMVFNGAEIVIPGNLWPNIDNGASADYYIQVGFPNISLEGLPRDSVWHLYNPHAIHLEVAASTCVLPEPLLSRRLRGPVTLGVTDGGIYAEFLSVNAKVREVSDMIMPVQDGVVGIAPGPQRLWLDNAIFVSAFREEAAAAVRERHNQPLIPNIFNNADDKIRIIFRDTAWFALWKSADMPQHREMGIDTSLVPLAAPPLTPQQNPNLVTYLVPGGFRCVR